MSIFSSIDRISRSSGSSYWPVNLLLDLFPLRVGLDVVDVVAAQPLEGVFVGGNRPLDLVLHDVLVLLLHHAQQLAVAGPLLSSLVISEWCLRPDSSSLSTMNGLIDGPRVGDQGVGDLVLHVAGRDAVHPFGGLFAELLDVLFGEAGQRLAVVELELLQQRQAGVLGRLRAASARPTWRPFRSCAGRCACPSPSGLL
jgi:hypothetical protein